MDVPVVATGMSITGIFMNSNEQRLIEVHLQHEPTWSSPTTGTTSEVAQPTTLPGYLGSEALFIPRTQGSPTLNAYQMDIIDLDALPKDTPFSLGYLYGGIVAMPSKFYQEVQVDSGKTPNAINDKIYEVFVKIPGDSN